MNRLCWVIAQYVQHINLIFLEVPHEALHYGVKPQEPVQPPGGSLRENPTVDGSDRTASHDNMGWTLMLHTSLPSLESTMKACE